MLRIGVVGATGYTGSELIRLLIGHPEAEISILTSRKYAGDLISDVFPSLRGRIEFRCQNAPMEKVAEESDFIFSAVPHKTAMEVIPLLHERGKKIVDLSADFRFRDPRVYEKWYQPHTCPELLKDSVYGLPELYRSRIKGARIVGNPGCYPTGALLPLIPLIKQGVITPEGLVIDSKSGVSGAGRELSLETQFSEVNEGLKAYKILEHRHCPEIEQELSGLAGHPLTVIFTPHLIPMSRGILTTIYCDLAQDETTENVLKWVADFYREEPFVRLCPLGKFPNTLDVRGSNFCDIGLKVDQKRETLIAISAIDNLMKGASGQAIQNMNIMCDFPENMGLEVPALFP
ncbi:MAG: N-acetyl-gamma-glutamyl-phosphate reductase [Proteobacteria bacterium]|nr:N-acetyl-gamma-glutamyl-phosphate reductase [Pseudomonadota bacterium]